MRKFILFLTGFFLLMFIGTNVSATVLTFDENPANNSWGGTYQGFTMTNSGIYNYTNTPVSGDNFLINYNSRVGEFSYGSNFFFNGAYFSGSSAATVNVWGYSSDSLVHSTQINVTQTMAYFDFNWAGIDEIMWDPIDPTVVNVGIDNFTFNADQNPVPEPTTILLFGVGLLGLAGVNRRKG
ncbi:PEP-CTERM sorting domain-containing protein [uncultured Desulfobacter sp.]|uniref:PEP-CTERM sorting domain-containing protein n=1 Tax=uncultured Desulfobacter sp. TaxID=240139 RepID=UPI002AAB4EE7|nr:PEP-CTERM sorting domain-containing protein [uncultured Desulfobacter sp.]